VAGAGDLESAPSDLESGRAAPDGTGGDAAVLTAGGDEAGPGCGDGSFAEALAEWRAADKAARASGEQAGTVGAAEGEAAVSAPPAPPATTAAGIGIEDIDSASLASALARIESEVDRKFGAMGL
jgi:hypothetical protein